jgi:rhodanese-related sulfurtransferase
MVEHVPPQQAWQGLNDDPDARLVDVRTEAEWNSVGIPDLDGLGKQLVRLPWQFGPGQPNPEFLEGLREAGLGPEHTLYFICRSGARSAAAAEAAAATGYRAVINVANGFEGSPLARGWKSLGLPWKMP